MSNITKYLTIKELYSLDNYVIPIYQRNYAWGNAEIAQLIQDIVDCLKDSQKKIYYIGTLIVHERIINNKSTFEIIDGQQRLTTLTILLSLIKMEYEEIDIKWYNKLNIAFDSRKKSTDTLQFLFDKASIAEGKANAAIMQGYADAKKTLAKILLEEKDHFNINDFCKYLFGQVTLLRVLVPYDTDLNHYFEIMNNRGEQLEKHEILKARCLKVLDEEDRYAFNLIWEACCNMEKYVQYGFNTEQRNFLFGKNDWNKLIDYDDVYKNLSKPTNDNNCPVSVKELLSPTNKAVHISAEVINDNPERFSTIINFSNFILHILKIQTGKDIQLDDKKLIESFEPFLKDNDVKNFVKALGYNLLKGKFLFDKYIIKRDYVKEADRWSLQYLKCYESSKGNYVNSFGEEEDSNNDENREILMLLSMFHVSNPTLVYKHWLNACLKYLFENENTSATEYKNYLEKLAKAFLRDRFLSDTPMNYYDIIYTNKGVSINDNINLEKLDQGTYVDNFIFNYLDYQLWQDYKNKKNYFSVGDTTISDNRVRDFEFTFRSSVEHYYPQHPIEGNPFIKKELLDNFGNLCLISSSKNSRLSNYMPSAKKDHYAANTSIDSIKQRIMMAYPEWKAEEITEHGNIIKKLLIGEG